MTIYNPEGLPTSIDGVMAKRPFINSKGQPVIAVNTGRVDSKGQPIYANQFVANATLRKDEWVRLDTQLIKAAQERLVIIDDLRRKGLVYSVGGLGTMVAEWETQSEMTDAGITMDGESVVEKDRPDFGLDGVPIPIIHKDFSIGDRQLQASRSRGAGLDVTAGEAMARAVARTSESMIFNGSSLGEVAGHRIYGLLNKPNAPIQQINDWSASGTTGADVLADVLSLVNELETQHRRYGPFTLYVPAGFAAKMREDFKANGDRTIQDRLLATGVIESIRVSDVLEANTVVLIQLTSDVIDLAVASDITTIQWSSGSGFRHHFKTFAAWAPRIKTDYDSHFGYIIGSTST